MLVDQISETPYFDHRRLRLHILDTPLLDRTALWGGLRKVNSLIQTGTIALLLDTDIDQYTHQATTPDLKCIHEQRLVPGEIIGRTFNFHQTDNMDVTSLLNTNSMAVEQQRKEESDAEERKREVPTKAPSRNRTPWDAGGYSLPINTIFNQTTPPRTEEVQRRESQSTPTSPRHKFSDSRSSLSSFTSSLQSASHSRFSSLSTVGSAYPSNNLTDAPSSIPGQKPQALDFGHPSKMKGIQPNYPQPGGSVSPTESLDALALVAEKEIAGQQARQLAETSKAESMNDPSSDLKNIESGPGPRPSSPSDAILIKRASAMPNLRLDTGEQELNGMDRALL